MDQQEETLNDQFVIETLSNLLLEYNEPYVEKRARVCGQSDDYQSEFFVSLEQITKNEQTIKNLIELCMFVLDKAQQRAMESDDQFAQLEEQINQLQERINFESKNSKQFQKMLKEESLKVKEQLEIIQQLEQQVVDRDNQIVILQVNQKHRQSETKQKTQNVSDPITDKLIQDLNQQLQNQKKDNQQLKDNVDYYKQQYQKQTIELEDSLNELSVLKMEKIKNESKVKMMEQEIAKLNSIIFDQEQKAQLFEIKINSLNKQVYDLQNASGYKADEILGSMLQRNSVQTSTFQYQNQQQTASFNTNSIVNNNLGMNSNLKSDLPELSYRQPIPSQFNDIDAIKEAPENLEHSTAHSKKNTVIPQEFIQQQQQQNYDMQKLEEKLQKLATPRQIVTPRQQPTVTPRSLIPKSVQESQDIRAAKLQDKLKQSQAIQPSPRVQVPQLPKLENKQEDQLLKQLQNEPQPITIRNEIDMGSIVDDEFDTYFYEQKVKQPQNKKQFKLPPLSIGVSSDPLGANQQKTQQQQQQQQQNNNQPQQKISAPQQMYKEIYQANEAYFINMKQDQAKMIPQFDRGIRQSMIATGVGGPTKGLIKRDPYREFFDLLCQCVKLNSDYFDDIVYIDTQNYYQECKATGKPFNEWEEWIRNRLESQVEFSD